MRATFLPQIDALLALGFDLADDGTFVVPSDSIVTLTPIGQSLQLKIEIVDRRRRMISHRRQTRRWSPVVTRIFSNFFREGWHA